MDSRDAVIAILAITNLLQYRAGSRIFNKQKDRYERLWHVTEYLAEMINRSDVEVTEFDLIVLHELGMIER